MGRHEVAECGELIDRLICTNRDKDVQVILDNYRPHRIRKFFIYTYNTLCKVRRRMEDTVKWLLMCELWDAGASEAPSDVMGVRWLT